MNQLKQTLAHYLRKAATRLAPKKSIAGITFENLGATALPNTAPRALIIYDIGAIERYVRNAPPDPAFTNRHTVHWDSLEMVHILNQHGYVVDYADARLPIETSWDRYAIVIDLMDNLRKIPKIEGQTKIHFATYNHWLRWNSGELERTSWFKERTGITVPTNRQLPPILSDEHADYLTYFGTQLQIDSFSAKPKKFLLNISSCFVPPYQKKDLNDARKKFLWIAGGGALFRGMDLALEAFSRVPEANFYLITNLKDEPEFFKWAGPFVEKHTNIHNMGRFDLSSPEFDVIADQCIGTFGLSTACGGPGSIARVLHNGLIPISMPTNFIRAEHLGYQVSGATDQEIITSTINRIREIIETPSNELKTRSDAVREFAQENHTRESFSRSFSSLLQQL
jgi:hypothetical protein